MKKLELGQSDFKDVDFNKWYQHLGEKEKHDLKVQVWRRTCPVAKMEVIFS